MPDLIRHPPFPFEEATDRRRTPDQVRGDSQCEDSTRPFDSDGYCYDADNSDARRWRFSRA